VNSNLSKPFIDQQLWMTDLHHIHCNACVRSLDYNDVIDVFSTAKALKNLNIDTV